MKIMLDLELGVASETILTANRLESVLTGEGLESDGT